MSIKQNIQTVLNTILSIKEKKQITRPITLVAVTKYVTVDQMRQALDAGITHIGENKVQDALPKIEQLKKEYPHVNWHMIGHLQSNKVNKAIGNFQTIQSVDSLKLLHRINRIASEAQVKTAVMLQYNSGDESQKSGFSKQTLLNLDPEIFELENIKITGIMVVTPYYPNVEDLRNHFKSARSLFDRLNSKWPTIKELSMGMSHGYELAIEEGATMVRIGSDLFK